MKSKPHRFRVVVGLGSSALNPSVEWWIGLGTRFLNRKIWIMLLKAQNLKVNWEDVYPQIEWKREPLCTCSIHKLIRNKRMQDGLTIFNDKICVENKNNDNRRDKDLIRCVLVIRNNANRKLRGRCNHLYGRLPFERSEDHDFFIGMPTCSHSKIGRPLSIELRNLAVSSLVLIWTLCTRYAKVRSCPSSKFRKDTIAIKKNYWIVILRKWIASLV